MFLFKLFGFFTGLATADMTEKQCYQQLKIMEQKLLREEMTLYNHLTEESWKNILTSNVQEFRRWTLASASLGRYLHRLDITPWARQKELEELIDFIKGHLAELESQRIHNPSSSELLIEDDFEVINKEEVSYQQVKDEWENHLRKLENRLLLEFNQENEERGSHYQVLGVSHTASLEEVQRSYRRLALEYHPDKQTGKSEAERKAAEEKMKEINHSYQVLSGSE